MYNTDLPNRADLPTSAKLWRSTIIAAAAALAILVTIVMPSEYGIDPTGAGKVLGLTEMGEIKTQLAAEAAADAANDAANAAAAIQPATSTEDDALAQRIDQLESLIATMQIEEPQPQPVPEAPAVVEDQAAAMEPSSAEMAALEPETAAEEVVEAAVQPQDEVSFTLTPGQGAEIKLVMEGGARADYWWSANGAVVNFDTHGDGGGESISYEKGRGVAEDEGVIEAAFTGNHGWFWRNRTDADVTVTLRTSGDYTEVKRMM